MQGKGSFPWRDAVAALTTARQAYWKSAAALNPFHGGAIQFFLSGAASRKCPWDNGKLPVRASGSVQRNSPMKQPWLGCSGYRTFRRVMELRRHLDLDDVVLDSVHDQIADGVQAELPHDIAAMCFHGLGAQVQ